MEVVATTRIRSPAGCAATALIPQRRNNVVLRNVFLVITQEQRGDEVNVKE
jgi:hypothetical protein